MSESIDYIACMDVRLSDVLAEVNNKHINIYEAMDALNISNEKDRKYLIHELKNKDIIHESFQIQNMKQEILSRSLKIDDAELNSFEMAIRSLDLMNDEDIIGFLNYCFETNISHKSKVYRIANRDYAYYDKDYYTYYVIINNNTYLFVIHSDKAPEVMSVIDYNMNVVPNCNQNEIESEIIGLYVPSPIVFYPKGSDDRVKKLELFLLWVYDDPFDCDVTHDFLNDYSFIEMINNFMLLPTTHNVVQ